jgi:hypothetical protein
MWLSNGLPLPASRLTIELNDRQDDGLNGVEIDSDIRDDHSIFSMKFRNRKDVI